MVLGDMLCECNSSCEQEEAVGNDEGDAHEETEEQVWFLVLYSVSKETGARVNLGPNQ